VLLSDAPALRAWAGKAAASITLPTVDPVVAPILYAVRFSFSLHTALAKGTDIRQRANLAKSVTRVATYRHL